VDALTAEKVCHIRERIAGRIGQNRFRTWFGETARFDLDGDQLAVLVENPFVGNWIESNFLPHLIEAAREVVGQQAQVQVRVAPASEAPSPPAAAPRSAESAARATRRRHNGAVLRGEFESFVVGPCNQLAYSAALRVVQYPGRDFRLLVVHGGCGLGKTHLVQGICNAVRRQHETLEWRYLSGEEFTNEFVYAVKSGCVDLFRARFRRVDLLVIDDIHFLANKRATQDEFLHTFNAIDGSGKSIVLSSDRHPRSIATLSEPLINRLISGMVVQIDPPDFATRREILRRRANDMNCPLPPEVLDYLARRITRNVRELEGALYKLVAMASLMKAPINLELTQQVAADYAEAQAPQISEIERVVAGYFKMPAAAIRSRSRDRTVCLARGLTMYLIRKHTTMSFPEIGRALGSKNHSTVLMAVRRINELIDRSGAVAWRTSSGLKEASIQDLLAELEREIGRAASGSV